MWLECKQMLELDLVHKHTFFTNSCLFIATSRSVEKSSTSKFFYLLMYTKIAKQKMIIITMYNKNFTGVPATMWNINQ